MGGGGAEGFLSRHPLKKRQSNAAENFASMHRKDVKMRRAADLASIPSLIPNEGFTRVVLVHVHK